ncbi:hypothetical protein [uncultured Bacteroides sp.]|uniref:hypothetical protein n=1 Tax=uncultured Bacteroides sp. TaxID=162156 RepID=UPI00267689A1|nr:hypothetical protein [uncultured Bacteroides sp.]
MVVAALGLIVFVWEHIKNRVPSIRKEIFPILVLGLLFSLSSYFSIVYNNTYDFVFATYFVSMCVWLGGAYFVIYVLKKAYGMVTLKIIFQYLTLICAGHCILAVIIDNFPVLAVAIDSVFDQTSMEYFEKNPRLYSIGVGFDTAGIRFSCVLLGTAYLIRNASTETQRNFNVMLLFIIGSIGNMVSRTTVVGLVIACIYLLISSSFWMKIRITFKHILWVTSFCFLIVLLFYAGNHLYNTSVGFRQAFDYGFEGFINFYKEGTFSTHSSDLLVNSIGFILPDNMKTWIIGDGYFADPNDTDTFYMGTDMGYIRFIFYCGIIGLSTFLAYFICCTYVLCKREKKLNLFFLCLFVIQLIVWVKIPTDIFCFYALLLLSDGQISVQDNCLLDPSVHLT